MMLVLIVLQLVALSAALNRFNHINTVEGYLSLCMAGSLHKEKQSAENLTGTCASYSRRSCCSAQTVDKMHAGDLYKFNYNHCHVPMSAKCRRRFLQEWCFFECSPNTGPFLVTVQGWKTRKERTYQMPLCRSACEDWWNDCRDDYTCVRRWSDEFFWTRAGNRCPVGKPCRKFSEMYHDAKDFCEAIWDDGWRVTEDSRLPQCYVMDIPRDNNPNDLVAKFYAKKVLDFVNSVPATMSSTSAILLGLLINFLLW